MCACAHVSANGLVYAWPHPVIPKRYLATNPITPFLSRFGLKFPFSNYPHPAKHTHTHTATTNYSTAQRIPEGSPIYYWEHTGKVREREVWVVRIQTISRWQGEHLVAFRGLIPALLDLVGSSLHSLHSLFSSTTPWIELQNSFLF